MNQVSDPPTPDSSSSSGVIAEENAKLRGHLDRLVGIARKRGFQGSSPHELVVFLDEGLLKAQSDARQLAAVHSALKRLDPEAPIQSCARVIEQAAVKISAQEATIMVLANKSAPEQILASTPSGLRP